MLYLGKMMLVNEAQPYVWNQLRCQSKLMHI